MRICVWMLWYLGSKIAFDCWTQVEMDVVVNTSLSPNPIYVTVHKIVKAGALIMP